MSNTSPIKKLRKVVDRMQRLLPVLLAVIVLFSGCSPRKITNNKYVKGPDSQFFYNDAGTSMKMAESDYGYYFFSGNYLFFADKDNMNPIIVCNKPNCAHNRENDPYKVSYCNGMFIDPIAIFYNDKNLFVLDYNMKKQMNSFIKVSADGSKRKTLLTINGTISSAAFHRGVLYYGTQMWDENQSSNYTFCRSEGGRKKAEVLYQGLFPLGGIDEISCYGNNIYFSETGTSEAGSNDTVLKYDIITGKISKLIDNERNSMVYDPVYINDMLYFTEILLDAADGSLISHKIFVSDINGQNIRDGYDLGFPVKPLADGKYLYGHDVPWSNFSKPPAEQELRVYTVEGTEIYNLSTSKFGKFHEILPGGENHIFLLKQDGDKYTWFYADKGKIESKGMQWVQFYTTTYTEMYPVIITKD